MENFSQFVKEDDQMELPPGFRFHPTDEELITHYLSKKALDGHFSATAIGEVDMNKVEPWEMPWRAKMGEQEWYFFCVRDQKYPTGQRTNRATAAGYWKATGQDKEIFRGKSLVGMKKTLVFYKGRAPKGENTNWVIHEYRLEGNFSHHKLPRKEKFSCQQNEWVICRVFQKRVGGKKVHISGHVRTNSLENQLASSVLPPLIDAPTYGGATKPTVYEPGPVTCFSNNIDNHKTQQEMMNYFNNTLYPASSKPPGIFPRISLPNVNSWSFTNLVQGNIQNMDAFCLQDQTVFRGPLANRPNMKDISKTEQAMIGVSQETNLSNEMNTEMSSVVSNRDMSRRTFVDQEAPSTSAGPLDMDCFGIIEIDD